MIVNRVEVVLAKNGKPAMARAIAKDCGAAIGVMAERVRHEWLVQPWVMGRLLKVSMN